MILAAGRGNRMRPLTDSIPKPLLPIDDHSLIEHLLFNLAKHDFNEVVINLAHLGDKIESRLKGGQQYGVTITYSYERTGGLETGGGIVKALPLLGNNPFLVVSGDIWTDYNFSALKNKPLNGLAHLVLVDNFPGHEQGDFILENGILADGPGDRLTFGNIGVYHPDLFIGCKPELFPLGPLLKRAAANGEITGEYFSGPWMNVGTPENLEALRLKLKQDS